MYSPPHPPLFRCVCGSGSERRGSHPALRNQRGSDQGDHHRPDGLAVPHGNALHHRSLSVRRSHPWEVLPRKVWHLGECRRAMKDSRRPWIRNSYTRRFLRPSVCVLLPLRSFTPISCSTSWWSPGLSFTFTASPTCRSFASRQGGAAPRTATSNTRRLASPLTDTAFEGGTGSNNMHRCTHAPQTHTHTLPPNWRPKWLVLLREDAIKTNWREVFFSFCLSVSTSSGSSLLWL